MLIIPPTVLVPKPSDFPHREDIEDLLQKRREANITQGFIIRPNKTPLLPFSFTADININNNRLWQLFLVLAKDLPNSVCCTYGLNGEDPVTTDYMPKTDILATFSRFEKELTMDCSFEYSLLYHTKAMLMEVAVTESKYIKFSGSDKEKLLQQMAVFGLHETRSISFIDEHPKVVLPIQQVMPSARRTADVLWSFNRAFGVEQ